MIKVIWAAHRKPGMSDEDFYGHWGTVHAGLGKGVAGMRRYVQHHTLAEARRGEPAPTHDGASIAWFDDLESMRAAFASPEWAALREDAPNLFDRSRPMDVVYAEERAVLDRPAVPGMVKSIGVGRRHPDLSVEEFQRYWYDVHGPMALQLPGLRRYVQNHAVLDAYGAGGQPAAPMTHDGWAEMWFDSLDDFRRAVASPAYRALQEDGAKLFAPGLSRVVAREQVIVG